MDHIQVSPQLDMAAKRPPFGSIAVVVAALYLSQGLPGGLIAHALPAMLREQGTSLVLIGLLKLLALPWLLKFIWAPFVDGCGHFLRRSNIILIMQLVSASALFALSFQLTQESQTSVVIAICCLLSINIASATQDIATDGLTVAFTPDHKLGIANSLQVGGYKIGMILGGSGLLYMSSMVPIIELMRYLSALLVILLLPLILYRHRFNQSGLAYTPSSAQPSMSFWQTYRGFFKQTNIMPWLSVLLAYKLSDSLGSSMLKPMLIDKGWTLTSIGELTFVSSMVGLAGAFGAGIVYRLVVPINSLAIFSVLQGISVASFYFIATRALEASTIYWLVMWEQFCDGLSTVVLFSFMMQFSRSQHEGADYTLQASIQVLLAGLLGALSGLITQWLGYSGLYIICASLGAVTLLTVLRFRVRVLVKTD